MNFTYLGRRQTLHTIELLERHCEGTINRGQRLFEHCVYGPAQEPYSALRTLIGTPKVDSIPPNSFLSES